MKKTQLIDLVTTIRNTFVSFFAITMFVGLGVGLFLGIHWVASAMYKMANLQFEKGNAHHIEITFPVGLTDQDLNRLADLEGVDEVEAGYLSFQETLRGGRKPVVRVGQLPKNIDCFVEVEGTLPQKAGEIAIESHCAEKYGIQLDHYITFITDTKDGPGGDGMTYLKRSRFKVTALVKSPAFLATNSGTYGTSTIGTGGVDALAWIREEDFDADAYEGGKPYVLVYSNALAGLDSFGDEYQKLSSELEQRVQDLGAKLAGPRMQPIVEKAQATLDEGWAQYDDAARLLAEKRAELEEAKAAYAEAKESYTLAQDALDDAREERDELRARLKAGEITQAEHDLALDVQGIAITLALVKYDIEVPYTIDHTTMDRFLDEGQTYLDEQRAKPYVYGGQTVTLDTAEAAIQDAEEQLLDNQAQLENGEKELAEGQAQLDALKAYDSWIILPRAYNGAVIAMAGYASITQNLRWSMASLFLIVGLLVCYSAVSRMVHEQMTRIGTKKAVGFRKREINSLFFSYSTACVIIGLIVGVLLAVYVVEAILIGAMGDRFVISGKPYWSPFAIITIGLLELALILGSTWIAVGGVLKMEAVDLLAGESPHEAKERFYERWAIWKKLSLLVQTTINNCVNDGRRVASTLIGVAGCTALIVCAVMLDNNVMRSFSYQYEAITHYDTVVIGDAGSDVITQGQAALEETGMRATPVLYQNFTLEQPNGERNEATLIVPEDEAALDSFLTRIPVASSELGQEGAWVSEAYHQHFGAQVGDVITIANAAGKRYELAIAGFFEYHLLQNIIVLPQDAYEQAFGTELEANSLFVDTAGQGSKEAATLVRGMDGYLTTRNDYNAAKSGFDEFSTIARIVVVVYLVLAVIMAACVLLNLDFMFVSEKRRELIVLMINGYSLKDAKGYIWHDSVVLDALGIILGLILGNVTGSLTIRSIEQAYMSFIHGVSWFATGAGIVGAAVLAAGSLLIALSRIKKFDLTDINRF